MTTAELLVKVECEERDAGGYRVALERVDVRQLCDVLREAVSNRDAALAPALRALVSRLDEGPNYIAVLNAARAAIRDHDNPQNWGST